MWVNCIILSLWYVRVCSQRFLLYGILGMVSYLVPLFMPVYVRLGMVKHTFSQEAKAG